MHSLEAGQKKLNGRHGVVVADLRELAAEGTWAVRLEPEHGDDIVRQTLSIKVFKALNLSPREHGAGCLFTVDNLTAESRARVARKLHVIWYFSGITCHI